MEVAQEIARRIKTRFVEVESVEMPPVAIAERNGTVVAAIVSPATDNDLGLKAAFFARFAFAADRIAIVSDANKKIDEKEPKFPKDSMRKLVEQRMPHDTTECLAIISVDKDGCNFSTIPYFRATRSIEYYPPNFAQNIDGTVPTALLKIIQEKTAVEKHPEMVEVAKDMGLQDYDKIVEHISQAMLRLVVAEGFTVIDLTDPKQKEIWMPNALTTN